MFRCLMRTHMALIATLVVMLVTRPGVDAAWDLTKKNNMVVYWGQNAHGAYAPNDPGNWQKDLVEYCKDPNIDLIPVAFLNRFNSSSGQPVVNFANSCRGWQLFPGTDLYYCPSIGADIKTCQSVYGKKILISIGGGAPGYSLPTNIAGARAVGDKIWNMFGKGWDYYRPFGDAIIDGFDFDIEVDAPGASFYKYVASQLKQKMDADAKVSGKKWILSAAPQCFYPDAMMNDMLKTIAFDAVFVQFYNNPCGAQTWVPNSPQSSNNGFNFGLWDTWARTVSKNPAIKVLLAVPASGHVAGSGYISRGKVESIANELSGRYASFGGVAIWDASEAAVNSGFVQYIKTALNRLGSRPGTGTAAKMAPDLALLANTTSSSTGAGMHTSNSTTLGTSTSTSTAVATITSHKRPGSTGTGTLKAELETPVQATGAAATKALRRRGHASFHLRWLKSRRGF